MFEPIISAASESLISLAIFIPFFLKSFKQTAMFSCVPGGIRPAQIFALLKLCGVKTPSMRALKDSNPQPSRPKRDALSNWAKGAIVLIYHKNL